MKKIVFLIYFTKSCFHILLLDLGLVQEGNATDQNIIFEKNSDWGPRSFHFYFNEFRFDSKFVCSNFTRQGSLMHIDFERYFYI